MNLDNSSYTVTFPDLTLTETGSTVLIVSTDTDFIDTVKTQFERYIISSLVFYVQDKPAVNNEVAWLYHVSKTVEICIVDLDNCSPNDVLIACHRTEDDFHHLVFVSKRNQQRDIVRVLNAEGTYTILEDTDQLESWIQSEIIGLDTDAGM